MTLRQVPFTLRNDSGRVRRALHYDGFAVLPGVVPPEGVERMRKGCADFMGTDALIGLTVDDKINENGSKDIKVIKNRDDSTQRSPERWETHWDWKGRKMLLELGQGALMEHAPELVKRWKRCAPDYTSVVMTRKYTTQQRWHMDMSNWSLRDKKMGLDGEWLLVFMVLYGNKSGCEGAGPDICPFWPTKWMHKNKVKPDDMIFTRPVLAPGDLVIVRSTMLHRGGGGMDRAVGFLPFPPMTNDWGGFNEPWLPAQNGMTIREVPLQTPTVQAP